MVPHASLDSMGHRTDFVRATVQSMRDSETVFVTAVAFWQDLHLPQLCCIRFRYLNTVHKSKECDHQEGEVQVTDG